MGSRTHISYGLRPYYHIFIMRAICSPINLYHVCRLRRKRRMLLIITFLFVLTSVLFSPLSFPVTILNNATNRRLCDVIYIVLHFSVICLLNVILKPASYYKVRLSLVRLYLEASLVVLEGIFCSTSFNCSSKE